jgi:uracil-DNA glycosylase
MKNNIMNNIINFNKKDWKDKYRNYDVDLSKLYIHSSWKNIFINEFKKEHFIKINKLLSYCLKESNGKIKIFPYPDNIFSAFNYTPFNKIKVVILGQDPYHNFYSHNNKTVPQADGLAFSVPIGMKIPSSLNNIFKNLLKYKHIKKKPKHGNLSILAMQGILL